MARTVVKLLLRKKRVSIVSLGKTVSLAKKAMAGRISDRVNAFVAAQKMRFQRFSLEKQRLWQESSGIQDFCL